MIRSRIRLLAFLTALAMLVIGLGFSFAGKICTYLVLIPVPLFVIVYCAASRRALKVPLVNTARARRIYVLNVLLLAVLAFALALGGNAAAYYTAPEIVDRLRYLPLALLPLLLPVLIPVAAGMERPFSAVRNRKFVNAAQVKLRNASCIKIAITGSFGKTSVKNCLATILSERFRVLATPESFNTPLGIARTVDTADLSQADVFIAEMGARRTGDIARLCELVCPDHCILTGICDQHLQTFGSMDAIVAAKSEIFAGTKAGGYAVVGMDEYTAQIEVPDTLQRVSVGEHGECAAADVRSTAEGVRFKLLLGIRQIEVGSKLLGAHSAQNIALAAALAYKLGMTKEEIAAGIEKIDHVPHRLQPMDAGGVTVLDDAYNANVRGAAEAVETLRLFGGKRFVVTPGIVELGVLEEQENAVLGAKLVGLDRIILVGATLVLAVKNGYLAAGGAAENLTVVPTLEKAQAILAAKLRSGDAVLFLNDLPDLYA